MRFKTRRMSQRQSFRILSLVMNYNFCSFLILSVCLIFSKEAFADNGLFFKSERDALAAKGLTFDPYVIEDYVSVYKGGLIDNNQ